MIKLTDIVKEIKINNPKDIFRVTDEGKQVIEDAYKLILLFKKYFDLDSPHEILDDIENSKKYITADLFYILSTKYGENVINENEVNKLEDYIEKYSKVWGDEEEALNDLEKFKMYGWIK